MKKNAKLPVNYTVRSMCDELMARHFDIFEEMVREAVRLMTQMSTEAEVAYKSERGINFDLIRSEKKWLRRVTYVVYAEVVPYILHSGVFNEGNFLKNPGPDMFDADIMVLYENGVPVGFALYDSGVSSSRPEFIDSVYLDQRMADEGSIEDGARILLASVMNRFDKESRAYKEYCPPITILKTQEELFDETIRCYGWQITEDYDELVVYNR
ncbi:hypothetical protein IJ114_02270 [Candidatus Saccharibacteria bacterium]|nr:hypothetical protein [Candidatus Saccharibacteria bacterium]